MDALPLGGRRVAGDRPAGVDALGANRHSAVSQVIDVALHGADHDVLRHQLQMR